MDLASKVWRSHSSLLRLEKGFSGQIGRVANLPNRLIDVCRDISTMPATAADSASQSSTDPLVALRSSKKRSRRRFFLNAKFWLIVLSTIILGGVLFLIILATGSVQGTEFSPTHFQTRRFSFYEIPLLRWQITPIHRVSNTPETARFLTQSKTLPLPNQAPTVWHLVEVERGASEAAPGDAALLVDHLRLMENSVAVWKQWSVDHPKLAKELWPKIADLANRELYVLMPRILELTRDADDLADWKQSIDRYLASEYVTLIRDMRDAGRDELADALLAEALAEQPDNPELQSLMPDANSSTGDASDGGAETT